ncbi:glycosyltransferase family 25 protein [Alloalcanivorax xenomutans]|nr:glycosyltransferase family 25 protein [Alloalcanivorax xenomutans]
MGSSPVFDTYDNTAQSDAIMGQDAFNVLAIAMPTEVARHQHLSEMMSKLGVPYSLVETSPPVASEHWLKVGYDQERSLAILGRDLSPAEVGCFLSHRNAWKAAAESDKPTLILEGDALLDTDSVAVCRALAETPNSWELAMLYYSKCLPSVWHQQQLTGAHRLVKFANRRTYCLAAYMLNPAGAAKLLALSKNFYLPADDFVCGGWIRKDLNMFAVSPRAAGLCEHAHQSTLEAGRIKRKQRKHKQKNNKKLSRRIELYLRGLYQRYRPPRKSL